MSESHHTNPRLKKLMEKPWFLGAAFLAVTFGLFIVFAVMYLFAWAVFFGAEPALRDIGILVLAIFGAPFVIWRSIVAQGNLDRSKDRDYADLFTKAVEQLGATREVVRFSERIPEANVEVRLGAIYALERISRDSERDHIAVTETLCGYIRHNFRATSLRPHDNPIEIESPRIDLQAAIKVLGRRSRTRRDLEIEQRYRLDLRRINFSSVDFTGGNFDAALFNHCRLERADFSACSLCGTQFTGSLLNFATFYGTNLYGTVFDVCRLSNFSPAEMPFLDAYGISVVGADLTGIDDMGEPEAAQRIFGSSDTKLEASMEAKRVSESGLWRRVQNEESKGNEARAVKMREELERSTFGYWSDRSSADGVTFYQRQNFLNRLGLSDWPYQ